MKENNYPDDLQSLPTKGEGCPDFTYTEIDAECQRCERYMIARAAVASGSGEVLEILSKCKKCGEDLQEAK